MVELEVTVLRVANNRMALVREVNADLVHSSGFRETADHRKFIPIPEETFFH